MRVVPLLLIAVVVLFFSGLIAPTRSKRLQRWVDDRLQKGKRESNRRAGIVGDWTAKSLHAGQRINRAAVSAGRRAREKLSAARKGLVRAIRTGMD